MNVRIGSVQIAQGTLETIWSRLEDRPLISFVAMRRDCHGETQFEGHVESWCAGTQLDAAEVVEGIAACRDEVPDAIQPSLRSGQLEYRARAEAKAAEPGYECKEEGLERLVVRYVQESVVARMLLSDGSADGGDFCPSQVRLSA